MDFVVGESFRIRVELVLRVKLGCRSYVKDYRGDIGKGKRKVFIDKWVDYNIILVIFVSY